MKLSKSFGKLRKNPIVIFVLFITVIFFVIFISSKAREPEVKDQGEVVPKEIITFDIGEKPVITSQAKVMDAGNVQIVAQTGGIVNRVHVSEGDSVSKGKTLVSIANNYQGGNAASVSASIAGRQLTNINETYDTQKDLIEVQREIAEKVDANSTELRNIGSESISGTENLLDQSNDILSTLEDNLKFLEDNNSSGDFDEEILLIKQGVAQLNGQIIQIETGLKNTQYLTSEENPPAELSTLQKDATLKGLELQEKALSMGRDIAKLQYAAASIGASIFYPSSPISGIIEAVGVIKDQVVAPGMPLVTISNPDGSFKVLAFIPTELAPFVSTADAAKISVNGSNYTLYPSYVSGISTLGNQHTITYETEKIPDGVSLSEGSFVTIQIPLYGNCEQLTSCFIPIESVHQTQESTAVYVVDGDTAKLKEIEIGSIVGSFVEVMSGLKDTDTIIVTRNVIDGDKVNVL